MPCTSKFSEAMRTCIWVKIKAGMELTYSSQQLKLNFTLRNRTLEEFNSPPLLPAVGVILMRMHMFWVHEFSLHLVRMFFPSQILDSYHLKYEYIAFKLSKGQVVHCPHVRLQSKIYPFFRTSLNKTRKIHKCNADLSNVYFFLQQNLVRIGKTP